MSTNLETRLLISARPPADVTNVPTFVLKSSTNIIIDETFVALILDTTDNRARLLRYLQTGLEVTGKNGELSSSDDPKVDYQAPIAKGGQKYTFLVYPSPHGGVDFVPTKGKEPVNMQQFEEENRLGPAVAGLTANIVMDKKKPTKKAPSITSSPIEILPVPVVKIQSATPVTDVPIEILPVPIIIVDEVGKTPSTTIGRSPQVTSTSP